MDQYIPIPEAMDPPKTATEFPTAANSISSVPQLLGETSDHEDDADFPSEPPGAPALPVDESGNIVYKYRDFSHVEETDVELDGEVPAPTPSNHRNAESSIRVQKFPVKLYAILAQKEFHDIICWMPHGRAWKVLKPNMFESLVMPLFFEYSNYHSFNRLVNAWSFRRISSGPDRGSYYHELFLRGKPHLQNYMRRLPKTHKKLPMKKKDEPNFYKLDQSHPLPALHEAPVPGAASVQVMRSNLQQTAGSPHDALSNLSPIAPQQQQMIVTPNISPNYGGQGIMGSPNAFMSNSGIGNGQFMGGMGSGAMGMGMSMGGMNQQGNFGMSGRSGMGMGLGMGANGMGPTGPGNGLQNRFSGFNEVDDFDIIPAQHQYGGRGIGNTFMDPQSNLMNPLMGNGGAGYGMNNGYGNAPGRSMKNGPGMMYSGSLESQWQSEYLNGFQGMHPQNEMYGRSLNAGPTDDFSTASSGGAAMSNLNGVGPRL